MVEGCGLPVFELRRRRTVGYFFNAGKGGASLSPSQVSIVTATVIAIAIFAFLFNINRCNTALCIFRDQNFSNTRCLVD